MARTGKINNSNTTFNNKGKIVIKNKKKFFVSLIFFFVILLLIILLILNCKEDLSEIEDYSSLNAQKYAGELLEEYSKDENRDKFLEDYDFVQGAVGMYIMNNSTNLEDSFSNIIKELKAELSKNEWNELDYDRPIFWNGEYTVDNNGIVKFKFSNKSIEPTWIHDEELNDKIIFN